jgi:photosystem II stability/assembly factor-like uncharacterized protein
LDSRILRHVFTRISDRFAHRATARRDASIRLAAVAPIAVIALTISAALGLPGGSGPVSAVPGPAAVAAAVSTAVTWQQQISGVGNDLSDITFINSCAGLAVSREAPIVGSTAKVLRTTNGGRTWLSNTSGIPTDTTLNRVAFAGDATHAWVVGEPRELTSEQRGYIGRSFDGGVTWTNQTANATITPPLVAGQLADYEGLTAADVATAWIAVSIEGSPAGGRILKTTDRGLTWTSQTIPDTGDPIVDIHAVSATNVWALTDGSAANPGAKILHTTNGGTTWTVNFDTSTIPGLALGFPNSGTFDDIDFFDAMHGAVAGESYPDGVVLWTADGGVSWTLTKLVERELTAVSFADATTLWAVGSVPESPPGAKSGVDQGDGYPPTIAASTTGGFSFGASQSAGVSMNLRAVTFLPGTSRGWAAGRGGTIISTGTFC